MAKIVAKNQIDNVILDPKNLWNIDKINFKLGIWYNIGKVSYRATTFLLKAAQSKLVCKSYGFKKGESTFFWQMKNPFENPILVYLKIGLKYEYFRCNWN
jgi:hypothetical protein